MRVFFAFFHVSWQTFCFGQKLPVDKEQTHNENDFSALSSTYCTEATFDTAFWTERLPPPTYRRTDYKIKTAESACITHEISCFVLRFCMYT